VKEGKQKMNKVYVYGTLRPGKTTNVVQIPGILYKLGWFPGVKLDLEAESGSFVTCEVVEVDDEELKRLDVYEGYHMDCLDNSLFIRTPILDGFIYEFNGRVEPHDIIESGDWLENKGTRFR